MNIFLPDVLDKLQQSTRKDVDRCSRSGYWPCHVLDCSNSTGIIRIGSQASSDSLAIMVCDIQHTMMSQVLAIGALKQSNIIYTVVYVMCLNIQWPEFTKEV